MRRLSFSVVSVLTAFACGGVVSEPAERGAIASRDESAVSSPPPAPPAVPCVGHTVTWTGDGGWAGVHASSTITGCRTYERTYYPRGRDGSARCSSELRTAGLWTLRDLTAAIEDPVVTAAFEHGGAIGHLASPADGIDDLLYLDGARLLVGEDPPKEILHLVEVLKDIDIAECPEDD